MFGSLFYLTWCDIEIYAIKKLIQDNKSIFTSYTKRKYTKKDELYFISDMKFLRYFSFLLRSVIEDLNKQLNNNLTYILKPWFKDDTECHNFFSRAKLFYNDRKIKWYKKRKKKKPRFSFTKFKMTRKECKKWLKNKRINPRNGKKVIKNSALYKILEKQSKFYQ